MKKKKHERTTVVNTNARYVNGKISERKSALTTSETNTLNQDKIIS